MTRIPSGPLIRGGREITSCPSLQRSKAMNGWQRALSPKTDMLPPAVKRQTQRTTTRIHTRSHPSKPKRRTSWTPTPLDWPDTANQRAGSTSGDLGQRGCDLLSALRSKPDHLRRNPRFNRSRWGLERASSERIGWMDGQMGGITDEPARLIRTGLSFCLSVSQPWRGPPTARVWDGHWGGRRAPPVHGCWNCTVV